MQHNALGVIAIVIAIAGSAYAGNQLGPRPQTAQTGARAGSGSGATSSAATPEATVAKAKAKAKARRGPAGPQGSTGSTGAQGAQGIPGATGAIGPTVGLSDGLAVPDVTDFLFSGMTLSAPTAGKIFVIVQHTQITSNCSTPASDGFLGVYVDGTPVPGTRRPFTNGSPTVYNASGVSPAVAAGPHEVKLGMVCTNASGVRSANASNTHSISAILLGG